LVVRGRDSSAGTGKYSLTGIHKKNLLGNEQVFVFCRKAALLAENNQQ
jgi:hypothetical protein